MADFLKDYTGLPKPLVGKSAISPLAFCGADTSDCSTDSSCGDSGGISSCNADTSDCSTDGSSCTKDTPCYSDGVCSDTPAITKPTSSGSITVTDVTTDSITIMMSSIAMADYYEIAYRRPSDTSAQYDYSGSLIYTITWLSPNTDYIINYRGINGSGSGPFMSSGVTARTKGNTVFNWTYAGSNSNGSPIYGSEKLTGYGIYVTAAEWNELAGLVSEATGRSVSTVSRGDPISAYVVNTMARALNVSTVSSGSAITASFFNQLKNAYNSKIQ